VIVIVKVALWFIAFVPLVDAVTVTMLVWGKVIRPVALLLGKFGDQCQQDLSDYTNQGRMQNAWDVILLSWIRELTRSNTRKGVITSQCREAGTSAGLRR
jgi:hypothetical protein